MLFGRRRWAMSLFQHRRLASLNAVSNAPALKLLLLCRFDVVVVAAVVVVIAVATKGCRHLTMEVAHSFEYVVRAASRECVFVCVSVESAGGMCVCLDRAYVFVAVAAKRSLSSSSRYLCSCLRIARTRATRISRSLATIVRATMILPGDRRTSSCDGLYIKYRTHS